MKGVTPAIIGSIRSIISSLPMMCLTPFDASNEESRGRERIRRAALTSLTAAIARGISLATPVITIPITLKYLGAETYGLWMAVSSVTGLFVFCDLGLGNGLVTSLSQSHGKGDLLRSRRLISTATFLLGGVATVMGISLLVLWRFVDWPSLFNVHSSAAGLAAPGIVAAYAFCFILNLPLATVQRAQMALQEGFVGNLWQCLGSLIGLACICGAVAARLSAPWIVFSACSAPLLSTFANWIHYFHIARPSFRPSFIEISYADAALLLKSGAGFLLLSILTTTSLFADNILIAHILGLEAVTAYAIPLRIATILNTVVALICSPLWAANGEALARGDSDWVRQNTKRIVRLSVCFTAIAAFMFTFVGKPLLYFWLGRTLDISVALLGGLGFSAIVLAAASPYFMVLNGANVVFPQVVIFLIFTPIALAAKSLCLFKLGLEWMPSAGGLCYLAIVLPATFYLSRRVLGVSSARETNSP